MIPIFDDLLRPGQHIDSTISILAHFVHHLLGNFTRYELGPRQLKRNNGRPNFFLKLKVDSVAFLGLHWFDFGLDVLEQARTEQGLDIFL